ncbi:surface protein (macronuclear) [Tetrahymena thermophila SB210]|uniref:Surface protein n=1 Tax=Tetrahymena thermophila (strain SB210) TaxID=312017 RepID=I7M7X3_TETTS|nr:surface protein [Tetrahymena thermophila SB210]EAR96178.2 surface protein [Tetrahymena thermophila SB210]|eukprot:XP_001016423.2 surface protein [Tetrahymena thermophila SB210]
MKIALSYVRTNTQTDCQQLLAQQSFVSSRSECLINQGSPNNLNNNDQEFANNLKGLQNNNCIGAKQIICKSKTEYVLSTDNCKSDTIFVIQKSSSKLIQKIYLQINFLIESKEIVAATSTYTVNSQSFPPSGQFLQWCDNASQFYYHLTEIKADINSNNLNIQFKAYEGSKSYNTIVYGFVLAIAYCPDFCDQCDNSGCTKCSSGYNLSNGICNGCDDTCLTCSGPGKNQCITCKNNYYISDKNNYCVSSCDSNQYIDSTSPQKYCRSCMSNCQACTYSNNCQACYISYYYTGSQCAPCDNTCYSCSGPGKNQCTKCQNNYYISEKLNNYCDPNCDINQAQFIDSSNPNQKYCRKCITNCKNCINNTSCTTCIDSYYPSGSSCAPCDNTCYSCSGPGKNQCTKCQNNYYISEKLNNYCDPNCDLTQGQFIDSSNPNQKYCRKCINNCNNCTNNTSCTKCIDSYYISGNTCAPCDNTCYSCTGPGKNQCTKCQNNYYISEKLNNYCDPNCDLNQGQFVDQSNPDQKYCKKCISNCKNCNNNTSCTKCIDNYYLSGNTCAPCDNTCYSCTGPGKNQCTKCQNNYYISEKLNNYCEPNCDLDQGQFVDQSNPDQKYCKKCITNCKNCINNTSCTTCIDNYYVSGNTCSPCDNSCKQCSGPGVNQCIICRQSAYLIQPDNNNTCVQSCDQDNGYYIDKLTNPLQWYCRKCLSSCKTCLNGNSCSTCFDQNFLNSSNQCQPCDSTCQTCNGPQNTNCMICKSGLHMQLSTSLCVQSCDSNEFLNALSQCQKCDNSCKTCDGSSSSNCKSCYSNYYLYNKSCVPVCPNGYSLNTNTLACEPCQDKLSCNNCYNTCQLCTLGQIQSQKCNTCYSETRRLDSNNNCVCLNPKDQRNLFYQCSYQNIAVLYASLSESTPKLIIDFGSPLKQIVSSPNQLCKQVFEDQTFALLGSDCTCQITDNQIIVSLTNSSSIMENNLLNFKSDILQFQDYNVFIDTFYRNIVFQNKTDNPILQFQNNFIENTCNPVIISLSELKNDAGRGFFNITWSIEEITGITREDQIQSLNQIMKTASSNLNRTLIIEPSNLPPNQNITIKFSFLLKVNKTGQQTFKIFYRKEKIIRIHYQQSIYPPIYRYCIYI